MAAAEDRSALAERLGALRVGPEELVTGVPGGCLDGVEIVVKDVFDVAGQRTGAGNPDRLAEAEPATENAEAVQCLVDAGATVIGKAHTDEIALSLAGTNVHYGTPLNSRAPDRIPGGSSSGPVAAVAGGLVRLALGTDTGGSIRVPASYCGVFGYRPTHGRISMAGVTPLAPSFDTVGLLAADGELLQRGGLALLHSTPRAHVAGLVLASDLLTEADPEVAEAIIAGATRVATHLGIPIVRRALADDRLDSWAAGFLARQQGDVWTTHGRWVTARRPRLGPGIAARLQAASQADPAASAAAEAVREEVRKTLDDVLGPNDALVLPSAATVAPRIDSDDAAAKDGLRRRTLRLTCVAALGGFPAVGLPLALAGDLPVGVCLVGRQGDDERLLATAAAFA